MSHNQSRSATPISPGTLTISSSPGGASDVAQVHPQYAASERRFKQMRDTIAGQDVIKGNTTTYLPPLNFDEDGECLDDADYNIYLQNAEYYNATALTFEAFTGMIFRKLPQIGNIETEEVKDNPLLKNVDYEGTNIFEFSRNVVNEINSVGRVGILYDLPTNLQVGELTLREQEDSGVRGYIKMYVTESIINWKYRNVNGIKKLETVVLREQVEKNPDDAFDHDFEFQYRALLIEGGKYVQRIYNSDGVEDEGAAVLDIKVDGKTLTDIPFVCINSDHIGMEITKPPLLDMADTNLAHYRASASLGANIFMFSRVTPIFKVPGQYWEKFREQTMEYGVTKAIVIPTTKDGGESGAAFLEPMSDFTPIVNQMTRLEQRMASQGARMLKPAKAGVEAADTVRMDMMGELSILASISKNTSMGLTIAVSWLLQEPTEIALNSDFLTLPIDAGTITALLMALQAGRISEAQYIDSLVRGEAIKPEKDIITDVKFTPSPDAEMTGVPAADGELKGREDNVKKKEPLSGPNGEENR